MSDGAVIGICILLALFVTLLLALKVEPTGYVPDSPGD